MRRFVVPIAVSTLCLFAAIAARPAGLIETSPGLRAVLADGRAFIVGRAEPIVGGIVQSVDPCPSGRYVALTRVRPLSALPPPGVDPTGPIPSETSLLCWDARTGRLSTLWRYSTDGTGAQIASVSVTGWFATTTFALAETRSLQAGADGVTLDRRDVWLINAASGNARALAGLSGPTEATVRFTGIVMSPAAPIAMALWQQSAPVSPAEPRAPRSRTIIGRFVRTNGDIDRPVTLPAGFIGPQGWIDSGATACFVKYPPASKPGEKRPPAEWIAVSSRDSSVRTLPEAPAKIVTEPETTPLPIAAVTQSGTVKNAVGEASATPVWLVRRPRTPQMSTNPTPTAAPTAAQPAANAKPVSPTAPAKPDPFAKAMVAADADPNSALLLPDGSAALYTKDGVLYSTPLFPMTETAFGEVLAAARRRVAISNGKQIGLAMLMYAQDYDENFPVAGANLNDTVLPYIRNSDILSSFVFSYTGPSSLSAIEKPAETILGYIPGDNGRAVVYVDGHVKWQTDGR